MIIKKVKTDPTPEMYAALCILQRQLSHSGVGGGTALRRVSPAQGYTTFNMFVELVTRAPYTLL